MLNIKNHFIFLCCFYPNFEGSYHKDINKY